MKYAITDIKGHIYLAKKLRNEEGYPPERALAHICGMLDEKAKWEYGTAVPLEQVVELLEAISGRSEKAETPGAATPRESR